MKRTVLALWAILACFGTAAYAHAGDWISVPTWEKGDRYYFDASKLQFDGDKVGYWKKVSYAAPAPVAKGWAATGLFREEIDCTKHMVRRLAYFLYSIEGALLVSQQTPDAPFSAIIPDTVGEAFDAELCARRPVEAIPPPATPMPTTPPNPGDDNLPPPAKPSRPEKPTPPKPPQPSPPPGRINV